MISRTFLIEPGYVVSAGHVGHSIQLFSEVGNFKNLILVFPTESPKNRDIDDKYKVERVLPNSYSHFLINGRNFRYFGRSFLFGLTMFLPNKIKFFVRTTIERFFWILKSYVTTKKSLLKLDNLYTFRESDKFVMPNADFVVSYALIRYLQGKKIKVILYLRFINVMENLGLPFFNKKYLFKLIERINRKMNGISIFVGCETDRYRDFINDFTSNVVVVPYPIQKNKNRDIAANIRNIGMLGSAREDKGFENGAEIVSKINGIYPGVFNFFVQESSQSWGLNYETAVSQYRLFNSVKLLKGQLTQNELDHYIGECSIFILPYSVRTYQFRGSAMLFEACDRGIISIAPANTAFGETIRKHGLGLTYSAITEIPSLLGLLDESMRQSITENIKIYNDLRVHQLDSFFRK